MTDEEDGSRPLVLVADDEPGTVALIADMLEHAGWRVVRAHDGLEALVRARETRPRVAMIDVMMPGLDGREVVRRLRADPIFAGLRIVLHSSADEDEIGWAQAGADAFIQKPFRIRQLPEMLRRTLNAER